MAERSGLAPQWEVRRTQNQWLRRVRLEISGALTSLPSSTSSPGRGKSRQALKAATAPPFAQWHSRCKSGDAHASHAAVGGIAWCALPRLYYAARKSRRNGASRPSTWLTVASGMSPLASAKSSRMTGFQNPEGGGAMLEPIQRMEAFTNARAAPHLRPADQLSDRAARHGATEADADPAAQRCRYRRARRGADRGVGGRAATRGGVKVARLARRRHAGPVSPYL